MLLLAGVVQNTRANPESEENHSDAHDGRNAKLRPEEGHRAVLAGECQIGAGVGTLDIDFDVLRCC